MKITTYKYVKTIDKETDIFIPEKPFFCFETGIRRSVRIIPHFVTWETNQYHKTGDIYELHVTCVYGSFECIVEKFSIQISMIEELIKGKDSKATILQMLLNNSFDVRTEEQFNTDLNNRLKEINEL